jgi:DNA polymerase-3 subunit epsilon
MNLRSPRGNIVVYDTETNGLPRNWKARFDDTNNWPRAVSLSWYKVTPNFEILSTHSYIIKPENFNFDSDAVRVHGITQAHALAHGVPLAVALSNFENDVMDSAYLVAHNIEFDFPVLYSEYTRTNVNSSRLASLKKICTMKSTVDFCQIHGMYGYKFPKLEELHLKLFNRNFGGAHNSQNDARACLTCLQELYNRNVIQF